MRKRTFILPVIAVLFLACGSCARERKENSHLIVGLGDTPYEREDVRREVLSTPFTENVWTVPLRIEGGVKRITFSGEYLLVDYLSHQRKKV